MNRGAASLLWAPTTTKRPSTVKKPFARDRSIDFAPARRRHFRVRWERPRVRAKD
jgi:hypothetical protein